MRDGQDIQSERVPEGWIELCLGDHVKLQSGYPFKSEEFSIKMNNYLPLVRIRDLFTQTPDVHVMDNFPAKYTIENGDILIGMDGEFSVVIWSGERAALNQRLLKISTSSSLINQNFLFYRLQPELRRLEKVIEGTTVKHLSTRHINDIKIFLPPLPEQRRIAEILGSVDEAIAATQALIDQTRTVKQTLLQHLLTKGIGHTRFKQTEIGEIPEAWEVVRLESLAEFVTSGSRGWAKYYSDEGAVFIRITNLDRDNIYMDSSDIQRVLLPSDLTEGTRTRIKRGDVLISITADLGIIGYVSDIRFEEAYINQHIALCRFNPEKIHSGYLAYALSSPFLQRHIQSLNDAGAKAGLNLSTIRNLPIPLARGMEQNLIFKTLASLDHKITLDYGELVRLKSLKSALLDNLLTGRKRVQV